MGKRRKPSLNPGRGPICKTPAAQTRVDVQVSGAAPLVSSTPIVFDIGSEVAEEPLASAAAPRVVVKLAVRLDSSLRIKELERELRVQKFQLEGAAKDAQAFAEQQRLLYERELQLRRRAETRVAYFRKLAVQPLDAEPEGEAATESEEEADAVADEADADDEEVEDASQHVVPDGSLDYKRSKRSMIASNLFENVRALAIGTAADVLGLVARRTMCLGALLRSSSMRPLLVRANVKLLTESRDYIMQHALGPRTWARWQHLAHISMGKLMQLRISTGYTRCEVTDSDSSEDERIQTLVPHSMHPEYEHPKGPRFMPVASERELNIENLDLRDGEAAREAAMPNGHYVEIPAVQSQQQSPSVENANKKKVHM
jgi:hypothetical protein